ncbi:uncharacterized protein RJT20DRAFT_127075 [Scheffersomyces xylosifermentans]|uniref:uncharacterized protein n=1 Tax=Scheffersomyces xylosifermentans TaxID=1304137 RepID=UPI00315D2A46
MSIRFIVSIAIRAAQLLFTIISLGLTASVVSFNDHWFGDGTYGTGVYGLVISIFTLLYLIPIMVAGLLNRIPFVVVFILEVVFFIFWLAEFAALANDYGGVNCYGSTFCRNVQAAIGFGVLNWLLFGADIVLLVIFSVLPGLRSSGITSVVTNPGNNLQFGGIFGHEEESTRDSDLETDAQQHAEGEEHGGEETDRDDDNDKEADDTADADESEEDEEVKQVREVKVSRQVDVAENVEGGSGAPKEDVVDHEAEEVGEKFVEVPDDDLKNEVEDVTPEVHEEVDEYPVANRSLDPGRQ